MQYAFFIYLFNPPPSLVMYDISDLKGAHLPFSEKRQVEEAAAGLLL
jgi:hypothetical protein